jgi:hypothetical membrane protein
MESGKIYLFSGIVAFLVFFIGFFFIFPAMYPNYYLPTESVSKLGALDSPIKTIVNVLGFSLWGILVMIGGFGIFKSKILSGFGKFSGLLIILGGFFIYLVGIFPSDGATGVLSMKGYLHNVEHFAFIPITLAFFILLIEFYKNERLRWLIIPIVFIAPISLILKVYRFGSRLEHVNIAYSGLVQRGALGIPFLVLAIICYGIYNVEFGGKKKS